MSQSSTKVLVVRYLKASQYYHYLVFHLKYHWFGSVLSSYVVLAEQFSCRYFIYCFDHMNMRNLVFILL